MCCIPEQSVWDDSMMEYAAPHNFSIRHALHLLYTVHTAHWQKGVMDIIWLAIVHDAAQDITLTDDKC